MTPKATATPAPLTIAVVGAGAMGQGIAQVFAQAGHPTLLFDAQPGKADAAAQNIVNSWTTLVSKGKMTASKAEKAMEQLNPTSALAECKADVIVEAIVELLDVKRMLFQQLEAQNGADTILCSNTSSLSITQLAAGLQRPERFAGLHFFNPAPVMKLVEVVAGASTLPSILDTLSTLVSNAGKEAVICKDAPGFIVNRVARPFYTEAFRTLEEGLCQPETLDAVMKAAGFRLGPCELTDLIGHDVNYAVTCSLHAATHGADRFTPSRIQQQLVLAGHLGRKTGKGFYQY